MLNITVAGVHNKRFPNNIGKTQTFQRFQMIGKFCILLIFDGTYS